MSNNEIIHDTKTGKYYFKIPDLKRSGRNQPRIDGISVNEFKKSRVGDWLISDFKPTEYSYDLVTRTYTGYKLRDKFKGAPNFAEFLDSTTYQEVDEDERYLMYESVFEEDRTTHTEAIEWDSEFEEGVENYLYFEGYNPNHHNISNEVISFSPMPEINAAMEYPDILLASRPCALTSEQVFGYLKHQITNNLNKEVAVINWNFSGEFSVDKKISVPPYEVDVTPYNANGKKSKRKKFATRVTKNQEVFRMVTVDKNLENNRRGQDKKVFVTRPIEAESHEEMRNHLVHLCDEILTFLNTPVQECETCKGVGVVEKISLAHLTGEK